uniref:BZIP domain-containing protein n=1 Tax=Ascaris lumbricoides TaxID=6252 RepID=A0A0M3HSZ4_ASCLU
MGFDFAEGAAKPTILQKFIIFEIALTMGRLSTSGSLMETLRHRRRQLQDKKLLSEMGSSKKISTKLLLKKKERNSLKRAKKEMSCS